MGTENPQENINKPNPATSKIDNMLCLSGFQPKNLGSFNLHEKSQCNSPSQQMKTTLV